MAIEPDTKDWTWVTGRRCPECGVDASTLGPADIAGLVQSSTHQVAELLESLGEEARTRPSPDTWSALEYGCHLRDVCRVYLVRLARMLAEDDPLFQNWDQDATATEDRYGDQDPAVVAAQLRRDGERTATLFATVEGDDWSRPGRRSDGATFTTTTFAQYLVHDLVHHLWDLGIHPPDDLD